MNTDAKQHARRIAEQLWRAENRISDVQDERARTALAELHTALSALLLLVNKIANDEHKRADEP